MTPRLKAEDDGRWWAGGVQAETRGAPTASQDKARGRLGAGPQGGWGQRAAGPASLWVWGAHNCSHLCKGSSRTATTLDFSCWGTVTSGGGDQEQGDQL